MKFTSRQIFIKHFRPDSLRRLIDSHLTPSSARGVDGTNYDRFLEKVNDEVNLISSRALSGSYTFSPFRQKLIIKDAQSPPRQVSIPTIRDKVALRALNNFLSEVFHEASPQHSHSVISSAIKSVKEASCTDKFIKLDIESFYDGINHEILLKNLRGKIRSPEPIAMIEAAITTPTGARASEGEKNSLGVPQGLSISNILASIYLKNIDEKYRTKSCIKYHRYVDDILCILPSNLADKIFCSIDKDLKSKKKLKTHPINGGKSIIIPISCNVEYLGYSFRGASISVRESTKKKLLSSLMRIIYSATGQDLPRSLWRLNLRISGCRLNGSNIGWMFYFSQINDMQLLAQIDAQIKKSMKKKFGPSEYKNCKRFIKTYHQIKYNYKNSNYFYNFDTFEKPEMIALLSRIFPGKFSNLGDMPDNVLRKIFHRTVTREVREMEHDTMGDFS